MFVCEGQTTSDFGKALRALYVERCDLLARNSVCGLTKGVSRLGFLPDTMKDYSEAYFRYSTPYLPLGR